MGCAHSCDISQTSWLFLPDFSGYLSGRGPYRRSVTLHPEQKEKRWTVSLLRFYVVFETLRDFWRTLTRAFKQGRREPKADQTRPGRARRMVNTPTADHSKWSCFFFRRIWLRITNHIQIQPYSDATKSSFMTAVNVFAGTPQAVRESPPSCRFCITHFMNISLVCVRWFMNTFSNCAERRGLIDTRVCLCRKQMRNQNLHRVWWPAGNLPASYHNFL